MISYDIKNKIEKLIKHIISFYRDDSAYRVTQVEDNNDLFITYKAYDYVTQNMFYVKFDKNGNFITKIDIEE
jgi:hypothetical protein